MTQHIRRAPWGLALYVTLTFVLGGYFTFASVQGDYGLMRRVEIEAEARALSEELDSLKTEVAALQNKTRRLSDRYLDLDLLDEQARSVLGYVRGDEIVVR